MVSAVGEPDIAPETGVPGSDLDACPTGRAFGDAALGLDEHGSGRSEEAEDVRFEREERDEADEGPREDDEPRLEVSVALVDEAAARFRPRDVPGPPDSSSAVSG